MGRLISDRISSDTMVGPGMKSLMAICEKKFVTSTILASRKSLGENKVVVVTKKMIASGQQLV